MRIATLAATSTACALVSLASANAAVTFAFEPGLATPGPGFTLINTFDTAAGIVGSGFQIKTPPADGNGAPPANSLPAGTPYLSVLGGGSAMISFGADVTAFQFDWGSIDAYNTLTINSSGSDPIVVPGGNFINIADGNQVLPGSNGRFTVTGTAGETFNSITLTSSQNSFEIDNLAVGGGVPEPATWALMIVGLGGVGAMMRRQRQRPVALLA